MLLASSHNNNRIAIIMMTVVDAHLWHQLGRHLISHLDVKEGKHMRALMEVKLILIKKTI